MYEAVIKTKDGEEFRGWMGSEIKSKKGFHAIKLEVTGAIAYIPDEEVKGDVDIGKIVNVADITITAPEKSVELPSIKKENPHAGTYYQPREIKPGSTLEKVANVLRKYPEMSRKEQIAKIVEEVGMTPAGASTYHSNAKKLMETK